MMGITATVFFLLLCQFGSSTQGCTECECCKNEHQICDLSKNCTYDCKAGYYGENCAEECLENCTTCVNGTECTECKPGYYSAKCNKPCGKGCDNNTCLISGECSCKSTNFIKGTCQNCSGNKYGDECNKTCPSNCIACISDTECTLCLNSMFYGSRCQYSCSIGCKDGMCYKSNGHCMDGCKSGYSGDKCNSCLPGLYGKYCDLNCGKGCVNNTCLISSGECPCKSANFIKGKCDACSGDKYGDGCNKTCPTNCGSCISNTKCSWCINAAYYGSYCQYRCSSGCHDGRCNKDGNCAGGCKASFSGDRCDKCSPGAFGINCDRNCTKNCFSCISETSCTECNSGFYGKICANACPSGCNGNCSVSTGQYCNMTDKYRVCARDTGRCLHGCHSVIEYGEYCEKQCSDTCYNKRCDLKRGHCLEGCELNFYGSFCDNSCSTSCISQTGKRICDGIKGHCLYGCIDGFKGPKCATVISDLEGYYTRSTLIGSTMGTFLAGGIVVGIAALITFIFWRRRDKRSDVEGYENSIAPCENLSNEDAREIGSTVTYEDLNSRDERLYSQITQQISPPANDYVNYSS